jgi:hypothetical protein
VPDITAGYPQAGSADFIVKLERSGSAPIPAAHTVIFQPFGVVELEFLEKCLHDFRRDVFEPQIFFDGNDHWSHKAGNEDLIGEIFIRRLRRLTQILFLILLFFVF